MRLQSYLSKSGVTSRRKAADLIKAGGVTVNGAKVTEPGFAVDPEKDTIVCKGEGVQPTDKVYFLFHKPKAVITTVTDTHGRKTVADFFKHLPYRLYPVGRLDQDTTGLLIMTNDGDFANRLIHPSHGLEKIYEAILASKLSEDQRRKVEKGLWLGEHKTAPCRVVPQPAWRGEGYLYKITLHEGRKRQIREMMKIVGARVLALHRPQIGTLTLGDLKPGMFRQLSAEEIRTLIGKG